MSMRYIAWTLLQLWIKIILVTSTWNDGHRTENIYTHGTQTKQNPQHNKYIMVKHCMIDLHCFVYPLYKWVPTSINTLPKANVSSNVSYHCPRISQLYYNQILVYNPSRVFTRFCAAFNHVYSHCPRKSFLPYSCTSRTIYDQIVLSVKTRPKANKLNHGPI